jgi:electron transfer flavoprotein alpha subunit
LPAVFFSLLALTVLQITVLVAGKDCKAVAEQASKISDVAAVLLADAAPYAHQTAEPLSPLIARCQKNGSFSHILSPASAFGKNVLPRVAALLDVQPIADIIGVKGADTFVRPIYAGNAIATVKSSESIKVVTIRAPSFERAAVGSGSAQITAVASGTVLTCYICLQLHLVLLAVRFLRPVLVSHCVVVVAVLAHADEADAAAAALSEFKDAQLTVSARPELGAARIVVSGGRGVGSADNFKVLFLVLGLFELNCCVAVLVVFLVAG